MSADNSTTARNTTYREKIHPQNPRVIIAEDNIINQQVLARMLEKLDCCVDIAINGLEVLDKLQKLSYDLIFMDCKMPEMDGYEATRRIRDSEENGTRITIIAVTAGTTDESLKRCLAIGMDDFISKPIQLALLREKMPLWLKK